MHQAHGNTLLWLLICALDPQAVIYMLILLLHSLCTDKAVVVCLGVQALGVGEGFTIICPCVGASPGSLKTMTACSLHTSACTHSHTHFHSISLEVSTWLMHERMSRWACTQALTAHACMAHT